MIKMATFKHAYLQQCCRNAGISTCGTKQQLTNRLLEKGIILEASNADIAEVATSTENITQEVNLNKYAGKEWTVIRLRQECKRLGCLQGI